MYVVDPWPLPFKMATSIQNGIPKIFTPHVIMKGLVYRYSLQRMQDHFYQHFSKNRFLSWLEIQLQQRSKGCYLDSVSKCTTKSQNNPLHINRAFCFVLQNCKVSSCRVLTSLCLLWRHTIYVAVVLWNCELLSTAASVPWVSWAAEIIYSINYSNGGSNEALD